MAEPGLNPGDRCRRGESSAWAAGLWRCCAQRGPGRTSDGPPRRRTAPMPCARSAPTSSSVTSRGQQMSRRPSTRSNGCFFSMSLGAYLEATATVATVARAVGDLDTLVAILPR